MKKVMILGVSGLIGHQVYLRLKANAEYAVFGVASRRKVSEDTVLLDARNEHHLDALLREVSPDFIVNCMGILIDEASKRPEHAIFLNAYTPQRLKIIANELGAKLIHISTDCVFSGKKGSYTEDDIKDADDTYGRTKALGEVTEAPHITLRTSVVGPEIKEGEELFHWFMRQEGCIKGFTKSLWSGVTTLELAKAVEWAIRADIQGLYHVTNGLPINKFELLMLFRKHTGKEIQIEAVDGRLTDKTLVDSRKEMGYKIPGYDEMILQMVASMREHAAMYPHYKLG